MNHVMALNDTLSSPAVLDGQWAVFDYARGYDPARAAVGVMDLFRLPKFSYYFFRSQRDATETGASWKVSAVLFIASYWTAGSDLRILVFSNCDEVELLLNGSPIARHHPAQTAFTQHLPHPPFLFDLPRFTPGQLEATGYIGSQIRARHVVMTPLVAKKLELSIIDMGVTAAPGEPDLLTAHARLCDVNGTLCVDDTSAITFTTEGVVDIVGPLTVAAEAGIASVVLRLPADSNSFTLKARREARDDIPAAVLHWQKTAGSAAAVPHQEVVLVK